MFAFVAIFWPIGPTLVDSRTINQGKQIWSPLSNLAGMQKGLSCRCALWCVQRGCGVQVPGCIQWSIALLSKSQSFFKTVRRRENELLEDHIPMENGTLFP